jgi:hypothetical protein
VTSGLFFLPSFLPTFAGRQRVIGMDDENCIWFHRTDGVRLRLIDFYRNSGEGLPHYIAIIRKKQEERGFVYGEHYGPHDLEVRE